MLRSLALLTSVSLAMLVACGSTASPTPTTPPSPVALVASPQATVAPSPSAPAPSADLTPAPSFSLPAELLGKTWKLTAITEETNLLFPAFQAVVPKADQSKYTIEFQPDRTFHAKADCNQVSGTYEAHFGDEGGGGHMSILPASSPLAACPSGSLGGPFVTGLGNVSSFNIDAIQLRINLMGYGTLQFRA
jgi:heat shock protein HslJ